MEKEMAYDALRGIHIIFMRNEEYRVELIEPENETSPFWGLLKKYKNTPYHFCYLTHNIAEEVRGLRKDGYMVIQEELIAPCIDHKKCVFLIHKDMGIVELIEQ